MGIIPCAAAIEGCQRLALGSEAAAKELGWTPVPIDGQADPQVQSRAMNSLINQNVDAIVITATDPSRLVMR